MPLHEQIIPYLETAGLYHLARLNSQWFWIDEPLDVAYQLGLPIDGEAVSGCLTDFENLMENGRPAWEWFRELFTNASEEIVRIYARAYIMMLLSSQLFADKNANQVHLRWLPYLASMEDLGRYSWGSAALAWLYRCLCHGTNRNVVNLAGPLQLLQSWIFWRFPSLRPSGFDVFEFLLASRYGLLFCVDNIFNLMCCHS
ncbi:hypothetical protein Ahy_B04g070040 isoform G [Arachis hypogaea]|uniref:Aminotransferase-like plant mobile domain-containing protein n=1 Tax=Arachis hypogaea TaxID=3818 RepID=A0A444ZED1_ARAHY|nr:hypothetical protein Ahy_B04g070040 isoform G [Arachis hypogaea]